MGSDTNRETAIGLLNSVAAGKPNFEVFAPDGAWWSPGRADIPIPQFAESFRSFFDAMAGPGRFEIRGVTAEGDRVAIEAASFFPAKDGRTYSNTYHFLAEFRDGKVVRMKEYCDTAYVRSFFGG